MRGKLAALAVIFVVLVAANWSKFGFLNDQISRGSVRVTDVPPKLTVSPILAGLSDPNRKQVTAAQLHKLEGDLRTATYNMIVSRRSKSIRPVAANDGLPKQDQLGTAPSDALDVASFNQRTDFNCANGGCVMTAVPGTGLAGREMLAMLISVDAGLKNAELAKLGLRPGKLSARAEGGQVLVDVSLIPTT